MSHNDKERGDFMPDYKEMYRIMFTAMTEAIFILQEAQIKCEELYMEAEPEADRQTIIKLREITAELKNTLEKGNE